MSDTPKQSRFKQYCPRCREVYVTKFKTVNIDGAFFGTSFPHHFIQHYKDAIILPPKVYHYEPEIFGFKIAGKRGSKYYEPPRGNIRENWSTLTREDKDSYITKLKAQSFVLAKLAAAAPKPQKGHMSSVPLLA